jgi:hypothetical protein
MSECKNELSSKLYSTHTDIHRAGCCSGNALGLYSGDVASHLGRDIGVLSEVPVVLFSPSSQIQG